VSTARPWLVVAAVIAVTVCAVAWPTPTGWAAGGTVGATALYRGVHGLIRGPKSRTAPETPQVTCAGCAGCGGPDCVQHPVLDDLPADGCTPACATTPGIRGLLEHVGIDTTGRDITVSGVVVDPATPGRTDQP
jgi:hypothetical protein